MAFNPKINQGDTFSNAELSQVFLCGNMGGMRRSRKTNSLVLISDHTKSLYDDKWYSNEFHYTGMGKAGDQNLNFAQNKTLHKSNSNGVSIFLFEVFKAGEYIYQGEVKLSIEPYSEKQLDINENLRLVWMFPLELISGNPVKPNEGDFLKIKKNQLSKAKKINPKKIKELVEGKTRKPSTKRDVETSRYDRDPFVVEYALLRANGVCQLCEHAAPFNKKNGDPYLQVHHIDYLSNNGSDTFDNVVAICPNCHAKMHTLEDKADIKKLKSLAQQLL